MATFCLIGLLLASADGVKPGRLAVIDQAPDFSLVTQDEKPLRLADLRGQVLLVGFVFTTCNGTCPATTHRMSQVQQLLRSRGQDANVRLLSITLDPSRDTPDALRRYQRLYDVDSKGWSFLTGPPADVAKTIAAWGMWTRAAANGQLDHPSRVFLVDARGRIREIYNLDFMKPDWVAEDIALLLAERQKR
jgi:protein SCO1/2